MKIQNFFRNFHSLDSTNSYLYLFTLCIITRLITSINYLEDIDSMRFALSLFDYSIVELRPHFPGYPVFCFISKIIYSIFNSVQITFSIMGGISIFIIIYYSNLLFKLLTNLTSNYLTILLFLNPLLWNLGNRYMSDLFGLSLLIMTCYYFILYIKIQNIKSLYFGIFILGLLAGVRISFIPFFIPILVYFIFITSNKNIFYASLILIVSVMAWLVPLILITGLENLYNVSLSHINGHFYKWGGSVITSSSSYSFRLEKIIESIWSDGMGGWWSGRHFITLLLSIGWIISFLHIRSFRFNDYKKNRLIILLFASNTFYLLWIFFFQNVVYKPRHTIPILPFILMISTLGLLSISKSFKNKNIFIYPFFILLFAITSFLNWQHQSPSAISQIKTFIINQDSDYKIFCSSNLINSYMKKHEGAQDILFLSTSSLDEIKKYYQSGYNIYSTKNLADLGMELEFEDVFYHNPYVNRLWSSMRIYEYKKSK